MPETLEDLIMLQPPTPDRPLLGTIILVVEDSRQACEGLRLICQRSGARIRRAESLASAERHLRTYRPRVAVIDLGLPDGSGLQLISQLASSDPRIDGIIATSGDETLREAALQAGADTFLPKPVASISHFQQVVLDLMPEGLRPATITRQATDNVEPDPIALRDDLGLVADLLRTNPSAETLDYAAGFLKGIAKNTGDPKLATLGDTVRALNGTKRDVSAAKEIAAEIDAQAKGLETV